MEKYSVSIFTEANQFILPETSMYDFFDYLAGEKLQLPSTRMPYHDQKLVFKFPNNLKKPRLTPKKPQTAQYKPIKLLKIPNNEQTKQTQKINIDSANIKTIQIDNDN